MNKHSQTSSAEPLSHREREDGIRMSSHKTASKTGNSLRRKKRVLVRTLVVVFIILIVIVGFIGYWELTDKFVTVHKGHLYRSAEVQSNKLLKLSQKHGIRTVVDLRIEKDKALIEKNLLNTIGVRHVHLPSGQVPKHEAVDTFIKIMDDPQNRPVLIHCIHGIGRTGIFSAIYRIEYQGWSHTRALLEAMLLAGFGSFRPNSEKAKFIKAYKPRKRRKSYD